MLEEYSDRINYAKRKHLCMLERFHIGDVVYPLFNGDLTKWGTVVNIDIPCRKIYVDFNGVQRQFDPEWLIHTNPNFGNNKFRRGASKVVEAKERFKNLKVRMALNTLPYILVNTEERKEVLEVFKQVSKEYAGKDLKEDELDRVDCFDMLFKAFKGLNVNVVKKQRSNFEFSPNQDIIMDFELTFENSEGKSILVKGKSIATSVRDGGEYDFFVIFS